MQIGQRFAPQHSHIGGHNVTIDPGQKVGPRHKRLGFGVNNVGFFPLDGIHLHRYPVLLHRQHFIEDKGLGNFGEARHHVGDLDLVSPIEPLVGAWVNIFHALNWGGSLFLDHGLAPPFSLDFARNCAR